jgi:hypothetical protein
MDIHRLLNTPRTHLPSEIPETPPPPPPPLPLSQLSTQSWDSQNGPRPTQSPSPPRTPTKGNAPATTRSDRIRIKTTLDFGHKTQEIRSKYHYTLRQIQWAKEHRVTLQKQCTS